MIHLVVPADFADLPSGGNVYDRHLRAGLVARGWDVTTHEVGRDEVRRAAAALPSGRTVLIDSLVASWAPEAFIDAEIQAVPLVHMIFDVPGESDLFADAPVVITTSEWTRRALLRLGLDPRRVHVAPPGVPHVLPTLGSDPGNRLLCVATLTPAKGHDVLLAALAQLTDLDWCCTLVGSTDVDHSFVDQLRKQAADAGITDRVRFAGAMARADVHASYASSDLVLLPSRAETYGMVVTEALAHGLPVVASAVGGVPEALGTVGDDIPGMLVRPEAPEALALYLRRWLKDPHLRRRVRHVVRARRRTLPTWEATSAAVASALEPLQ